MKQAHTRSRPVILAVLLTLVAVIGMTTVTASPATADTTYSKDAYATSAPPSDAPCDNIYRDAVVIGKACFAHYGDYIYIRDMVADGAGIYAVGATDPAGEGFRCYNSGGADVGWQRCRFAAEMNESPNYIRLCGWARKDGNNSWGWGSCVLARTWDA